jgi:hypothetical protein
VAEILGVKSLDPVLQQTCCSALKLRVEGLFPSKLTFVLTERLLIEQAMLPATRLRHHPGS